MTVGNTRQFAPAQTYYIVGPSLGVMALKHNGSADQNTYLGFFGE